MKKLSLPSPKQKKKVAILGFGLAILVIGGVIAYSHDSSVFNNQHKIAEYRTVFKETFDSPTNWLTCETVDKEITIKNESNVSVAVRVKIDESWENNLDEPLPLISTTSGLTMAQINEAQNSGWTRYGDYFYYNNNLASGETTTTPITGVTLNCDANLSAGGDDAYNNARYKLKLTAQTIEADVEYSVFSSLYGTIASKANDTSYQIDFTRRATISDDINTANGNGVNTYTENGETVYYYRGQISDNNVLWANKCWQIVRTTYTNGVKMIYKGTPSDTVVNGVSKKACSSSDGYTNATFNNRFDDVSVSGYMYGVRRRVQQGYAPADRIYVLSKNVSREGDAYVLDTSSEQSVTGTFADIVSNTSRMRYFCTDGSAQCDSSMIGYMTGYWWSSSNYWYINIGGYDNIEGVLRAAHENTISSDAKRAVDSWFVDNNLDGHIAGSRNYEDDLEDAIFCNDRTIVTGAMSGKDYVVSQNENSKYGAAYRNTVLNDNNNYEPSLDCSNKNDAFTVTETADTNGKLDHKSALITMDELVLAGGAAGGSYLNNGKTTWTMSPSGMSNMTVSIYEWYGLAAGKPTYDPYAIRPMVSLKAGTYFIDGDGTVSNPYVVK